jgi:hypothetical protein
MIHSTKIGVIIKGDLQDWQKLNVTAFLASGIAAANPDCIGEAYEDGTGNQYLPIFNQPVFVYGASSEHLQRTRARLESRGVQATIYATGMFKTDNDIDNRAVVKEAVSTEIDIAGLAFRADSKIFDKIVNGLKLHP